MRVAVVGDAPDGTFRASRGADGVMDPAALEDARDAQWGLGLHAGFVRSHSWSRWGHADGAALHTRWIRVQLLDDGPVLRAVALEFSIALAELPFVDRIDACSAPSG